MAERMNHTECAAFLKQGMRDLGCDVTVSTEPPLVDTGYEQFECICPHGTAYWLEPTSEQRAEWARDGVA